MTYFSEIFIDNKDIFFSCTLCVNFSIIRFYKIFDVRFWPTGNRRIYLSVKIKVFLTIIVRSDIDSSHIILTHPRHVYRDLSLNRANHIIVYVSRVHATGTRCSSNDSTTNSRVPVSTGYSDSSNSNSGNSSNNSSSSNRRSSGVAGSSPPTSRDRVSTLPVGSRPDPTRCRRRLRRLPRCSRDRWRCPTATSGNCCNSSTWPDHSSATSTCWLNGTLRRTSTRGRKYERWVHNSV